MEHRNAIRNRMKTIEETKQMASVMELSAAAGIHRAKERAALCQAPYSAAEKCKFAFGFSPFTGGWKGERWAVVLGGDRGLAGGYYARLFEAVPKDVKVFPIGKKTVEYASSRGFSLVDSIVRPLKEAHCSKELLEGFLSQKAAEVLLLIPALSGEPTVKQLLPLPPAKGEMIYDPSPQDAAWGFMTFYLSAAISYGAAWAGVCELAARREAMGAAASNAEEMLEQLTLAYHAARQAAITRELTEIVAGSEDDNGT